MSRIILASSSPRRIEIMKSLGVDFDVVPSKFEEKMKDVNPRELVCELAKGKAKEVCTRVDYDKIIIAADTVVYMDNRILGKPKNEDDAFNMLKNLSGGKHSVITGLCIIDRLNNKTYWDYEETTVYFDNLSNDEIQDYIMSGEPFDKAGAYGIQGKGGLFVKRIEGCYFNVVGLPIHKLYGLMGKLGVNLLIKEV